MLLARAPTWRAEVAVCLQYSRQVWAATMAGPNGFLNGGFNLTTIADIWRSVPTASLFGSDGRTRLWANTRGPISSMHLALHRVGWKMASPVVLIDHCGDEIMLTRASPALVAKLLQAATLRAMEVSEGERMATTDPAFSGRRVAFEHVVAQLKTDRKLDAADRAAYKSVVCGALMTFDKAQRMGYLVDNLCPKCRRAPDTVRHRIWRCDHPEVVAVRNSVAPEWLQQEVARRPVEDTFWDTALFPHPADIWPRPASTPMVHIVYGETEKGEPGVACGSLTKVFGPPPAWMGRARHTYSKNCGVLGHLSFTGNQGQV